jgi:O-succinylbenzoic acid--CoA ligase
VKQTSIQYQNTPYQIADIQSVDISTLSFSPYLQKTIEFCKEWLSGKETFIVNTSGSTGTPKPIEISRTQMLESVRLTQLAFGLKGGETALVCLHTDYIAGKMMLIRGLELGWQMLLQEPSSNPLEKITEPFDFVAFVPLQLQTIIEKTPEKISLLNQFKTIILGGAGISTSLETFIESLQVPVYHTYAMTETITHIATRLLNTSQKQPYFKAIEGVKIKLDERECLCITSPTTNFEEITTNDIAEIIDNQYFKIVGRIDNIINSGGIKIQLENIESNLEKVWVKLKLTQRFFCMGIPHDTFGQILVLCIEGSSLDKELETLIIKELSLLVDKYQLPKKIFYKKHFLETETGKIKRTL